MTYVKLFSSILASTIWQEPAEVRVVWITLLALADRDGLVSASIPGLVKFASVSRSECEEALKRLSATDPDSRTKDYEGRRIEEVTGGWLILNYEAYRDKASADEKREKDAARQRRKYARDKAKAEETSRGDSRSSRGITKPRLSGSGSSHRIEGDGLLDGVEPLSESAGEGSVPVPDSLRAPRIDADGRAIP